MNVAVLFDSVPGGEVKANALLAGRELYSYSLRTFYLHPCIDCLAVAWHGEETAVHAEEYIGNWREESGINKPVRIYQGSRNLRQILDRFKENGIREVKLYVLHDIRYPFVTSDMIHRVVEKAALYGSAVTAGDIEDDLAVYSGHKVLKAEDYRYTRYPMAVRAGHGMPEEIMEINEFLAKCLGYETYLCDFTGENLFAGTREGIEMAEIFLKAGKAGYGEEVYQRIDRKTVGDRSLGRYRKEMREL